MGETAQIVLYAVSGSVIAILGVSALFWRIVVYFDSRATEARAAIEARAEKARAASEERAEKRVEAIVKTLETLRASLNEIQGEVNVMKGGQAVRDEQARLHAVRFGGNPSSRLGSN